MKPEIFITQDGDGHVLVEFWPDPTKWTFHSRTRAELEVVLDDTLMPFARDDTRATTETLQQMRAAILYVLLFWIGHKWLSIPDVSFVRLPDETGVSS